MKEKIIDYIERLEAKSLQVDDYFKQRNDLYISNQQKAKEIERLNNIINELERYLEQQWLEWKDNSNDEIVAMANEDKCILDKLRELKGDSSNE